MSEDNKNVPIYGDSKPAQLPAQEQPIDIPPVPQGIIIKSPTSLKTKIIIWAIIIAALLGIGYFVAEKVFGFFHDPIIYTEKVNVDTASEVKSIIKLQSGFTIDDGQAKAIAETAYDSTPGPNYKAPDKIIITTGKDLATVVEQEKVNAGADVAIVTAKDPTVKIEDIKPTDTVILEQRNYQIFPKEEWGMNMYNDGSLSIDYTKQVKVLGSVAYVGTSILYDKKDSDMKYGVRIAFPL